MSKILIIEDEEAIADLEKDYLELSGFEVEIATRGDMGLEKALKEEYDLIILDLMLPEVDGFDICRQVRQEKNIPIIMVSAKKDDIDKIRGLGLGVPVRRPLPEFSPDHSLPLPSDVLPQKAGLSSSPQSGSCRPSPRSDGGAFLQCRSAHQSQGGAFADRRSPVGLLPVQSVLIPHGFVRLDP